jgi:hypothetical protein
MMVSFIDEERETCGVEQVEFATLAWVDWFNNPRLLGSIGHIPPVELERVYYEREASRRTLEVN